MTLKELKERCEKEGFKYAYGVFKTAVRPPHLCAITRDTDNFSADNRIFCKQIPIQLDYTYTDKDEEQQNKIENKILTDVVWNKTEETYLPKEKVWQVSYYFNI